jgi:soluble lytic murein transglycosylase-like protein
MGRDSQALVIMTTMTLVAFATVVLAERVIAGVAANDANRIHRAILEHVARKNPEAPVAEFAEYPRVLVAGARRAGIDHCLGLAQAEVESGFRPDAVGPAGEIGLYQILPDTAAFFEPQVGRFQRPRFGRGLRDLGDLANPVVSTEFAMAYLRDIMTRRPTIKEALTEYNGGPRSRHLHYYQRVMSAYVETLEYSDLGCRFRPVARQARLTSLLFRL